MTPPSRPRTRSIPLAWALAAGGLVALNLLADRRVLRCDWTGDRRFSLSRSTRDVLRSLSKPVHIRFFLTPDLPPPASTEARYVKDLLDEFKTAAGARLTVDVTPPDGSDESERELRRLNIPPRSFTEIKSDQYQVRRGYMALTMKCGDKEETMAFAGNRDNLEYDLSSRLRSIQRTEKKNLFFIANHNEVSPNVIKEGPAGRLFEEYHVEPTQLTRQDSGMKAHAVFLLGPQTTLSAEEVGVLDDYLASGVPLVVALNRRLVFPRDLRSMAQRTGLEEFLEHYGVRIEREFVMDTQCGNIPVRSGGAQVLVRYFPFVIASDLNRRVAPVSGLDGLGFPFGSALTPVASSSIRFVPLARSSQQSWVWPGLYNVDPPNLHSRWESDPPQGFLNSGRGENLGPFTLAAVVEGSTVTYTSPRREVPRLKMVVIGTSFFANPQVPIPSSNALFLLNLAPWLTEEGPPLIVPPKGPPFRPIKPLANRARSIVKGMGYFFLPSLVAAGGWAYRRSRREKSILLHRDNLV